MIVLYTISMTAPHYYDRVAQARNGCLLVVHMAHIACSAFDSAWLLVVRRS